MVGNLKRVGVLDQNNRLRGLIKLETQHAAVKNLDSVKKTKTESSTGKDQASKNNLVQFYQPVSPKVLSQFQSLFQEKRAELLASRKSQAPTKGRPVESKPTPIVVSLERNFTEQVTVP